MFPLRYFCGLENIHNNFMVILFKMNKEKIKKMQNSSFFSAFNPQNESNTGTTELL